METNHQRFNRYLDKQGLKSTTERQLILDEVLALEDHFEAEDLLIRLRQRGARISKGTIYRTLNLLVESGLVRQVAFVDKHAHYEHVYGHEHHEHLICLSCGKIINFCRGSLEEALVEICEEQEFTMRSHKIEVLGYCRGCNSIESKTSLNNTEPLSNNKL